MGEYKNKHGKTLIGNILKGAKDKGVGILSDLASGKSLVSAVTGALGRGEITDDQAVEIYSLEVEDRKNAMNANAKIQESENASILAKNTPYVLIYLLFGLIVYIIHQLINAQIPEANENTLYFVLGSVVTAFIAGCAFVHGSSKSSKDKMDVINKMKG